MATIKAAALTDHAGDMFQRIRKNLNKSKGPSRVKYELKGIIHAEAAMASNGDVLFSADAAGAPANANVGWTLDLEKLGEGEHEYTLTVETMNDDWVHMERGEPVS